MASLVFFLGLAVTFAIPMLRAAADGNADLVVTNASAPAAAVTGDTIEASWTVTNQGTQTATGDDWRDYVYSSDDQTLDAGDRYLFNQRPDGPLASGAS